MDSTISVPMEFTSTTEPMEEDDSTIVTISSVCQTITAQSVQASGVTQAGVMQMKSANATQSTAQPDHGMPQPVLGTQSFSPSLQVNVPQLLGKSNPVAQTMTTTMTTSQPIATGPCERVSHQATLKQPVGASSLAVVTQTGSTVSNSLQNIGPLQITAVQSSGMALPLTSQPQQRIVAHSFATKSKKTTSGTIPGGKMFFKTSSSPSKLIPIAGGSVSKFVRGMGNVQRILVPQARLTQQNTLRHIAPRLATSINPTRPPMNQVKVKPATSRAGKQVATNTSSTATGVMQQRVLLQAQTVSNTGQLRAIAPNLGIPPGSTIQFPPGTIIKDNVVYLPQTMQSGTAVTSAVQSSSVSVTQTSVSNVSQPVNGKPNSPSPTRQRKPCNCTKSQCLKLYCDCFANGEFCNHCNCNNCSNNMEHEQERSKAIKACLERNPYAFHPKIGKGKGETERRHNKGCHCKRSGCLKNYCECYEAKILCTSICKCTGCKNFEESPERKTLMHLADAAEVRVQQQNAAKTKLESQMEDLPSRAPILAHAGERLPFSFVTRDVVEATCRCLLVQASAAEKKSMSRTDIQKLVLEEFGNCLLKIIHTANSRNAN
ncbi:protein lin-54 homolog isoform X3 [Xenia sp. Carnegie-2017]|nr:protein lin-54 homolog isoform X3 [Xenia sp. Carnegie-2017]